jgi:hypothetical protein
MATDQIRNTSDGSELDMLLSGITDPSERKAVTEAFYDFAKGDPCGFSVRFAVLIKAHTLAIQNANKLNGNRQAPDLKLEQLAKLSKLMAELRAGQEHTERRTEVLFADLTNRFEDSERKITPENGNSLSRWPIWVQKTWAFMTDRSFIALVCLVLGALPGLILYVQSEKQRADDGKSRIVAMINKLPDSVRLNMTGNIQFSPAAGGNPAKVLLNFGQKLRPVTADVNRRSNEVLVVFAP